MISYSESKRTINLAKHGVDFASLWHFFDGDLLTREDTNYRYGQVRFQSIGWHLGTLLLVVWTPDHENWPRIISARKAEKYEQKAWARFFK